MDACKPAHTVSHGAKRACLNAEKNICTYAEVHRDTRAHGDVPLTAQTCKLITYFHISRHAASCPSYWKGRKPKRGKHLTASWLTVTHDPLTSLCRWLSWPVVPFVSSHRVNSSSQMKYSSNFQPCFQKSCKAVKRLMKTILYLCAVQILLKLWVLYANFDFDASNMFL